VLTEDTVTVTGIDEDVIVDGDKVTMMAEEAVMDLGPMVGNGGGFGTRTAGTE